jgi:transcription antitermination factor NusG
MDNSMKSWYILYTKPGFEKKVANLLSRRNFENYCPMKRTLNVKRRETMEPLFKSYVFIELAESDLSSIRLLDNVVNIVYWLGKPAMVKSEEIEVMKRFMNEYTKVNLEKIQLGNQNMEKLIDGDSVGKTHMVTVKNNTVKIALPSIGYMLLAEIEKSTVENITSIKKSYSIVEKYQFAG